MFLFNRSDWDVFADVTMKVGNYIRDYKSERFSGVGDGHGYRIPHSRLKKGDLLFDDGSFQLEVFVKLKDEEVLPQHNLEDVTLSKVILLAQKMELMEKTLEEKFSRLDEKITGLDSNQNLPAGLDCPICEEPVKPPMRLQQCGKVDL